MLISLCTYDTAENQRHPSTRQTLESLSERVDLNRHRIFICDNHSTDPATIDLLKQWSERATVIWIGSNLGTARAINLAWKSRRPGEHCVKMDNDVVVHLDNWPDLMEEVFARDPSIGICGLKRNDLEERPDHDTPQLRSTLRFIPHNPSQRWIVVEEVNHCIGTCQAYSSALLDKLGYLDQGSAQYGFDDCMSSERAHVAKFATVMIPHVPIDHIDNREPSYTGWKHDQANSGFASFYKAVDDLRAGRRPLYCPPEGMNW